MVIRFDGSSYIDSNSLTCVFLSVNLQVQIPYQTLLFAVCGHNCMMIHIQVILKQCIEFSGQFL